MKGVGEEALLFSSDFLYEHLVGGDLGGVGRPSLAIIGGCVLALICRRLSRLTQVELWG